MGDIRRITAVGKRYKLELSLTYGSGAGCSLTLWVGRSPKAQVQTLRGDGPMRMHGEDSAWHGWRDTDMNRPERCFIMRRTAGGRETEHCELRQGHGGPHHFVPPGVRPSLAEEYTGCT